MNLHEKKSGFLNKVLRPRPLAALGLAGIKYKDFTFRCFLGEDDLQKLVPIITDWSPEVEEEQVNIVCMFKLASTALKSRDEDLNEAIEALGDREADQEIKAENKKLKKENRELKKENKEQDKQLKRFQKAKSEGTYYHLTSSPLYCYLLMYSSVFTRYSN